jgi:hypothetical protein
MHHNSLEHLIEVQEEVEVGLKIKIHLCKNLGIKNSKINLLFFCF